MIDLGLPSLDEIFRASGDERARLLAKLPPQNLKEVVDHLRSIKSRLQGATSLPRTPVEFAVSNPRHRWMDARHIHFLGDLIADAVHRSKVEKQSAAIIVTMPPRHAKSHTCSVWTPFWYLARYPEDAVLLISYEQTFARKWGERVRRLVEIYGAAYGLFLNPRKMAADDWELTTGGGMKCAGAGGSIAGNPAKLLIFDDLVKNDEAARSDQQRENLWDWFEGTLIQRIEPDTTVIGIGTRYHEDDVLGRALKESAQGTGHHFDLVTLPAKAMEENSTLGIPADPLDRPIGEGLWLEHFSQDFYDTREATVSPYTWFAVYQQYPTPPGGNTVDPAWWRFYTPSQTPPVFDEEIQSWDFALDSEKKTDSYQAGLVISRVGALIYIRDSFHRHCGSDDVATQIMRWAYQYPGARAKLVERSISGPAMRDMLRSKVGGIVAWPPKGRQKSSKEAMLNACVPDIRSGNVLLPLNHDGTRPRWVQEFVEELRQFPRAPHDDWCDTFSQGLDYILRGVRRAVRDAHDAALRVRPDLTHQERHNAYLHALIKAYGKPRHDANLARMDAEDRALARFEKSLAERSPNRLLGVGSSLARSGRRGRGGLW